MNMKKMSAGMKFLIIAIVLAMTAMAAFGVSKIFAEPTIEDLAADYIHEIGEFKPSELFDEKKHGDDIKNVAWINNTQIMFSYDWWKDTNGDGAIDVEDVYSQEGFEHEMLMTTVLYPIFSLGDDLNYYVIAFPDFARYDDSVVIDIAVAENSDLANLKDVETYWFDRENNYLYVHKDLIDPGLQEDNYWPIRMETILLVKDVDTATKTINVYTLFDSEIDNTHGLYNATPNGEYSYNIKDWEIAGLSYQLVQPKQLAYVSASNLTVYANCTQIDTWAYDETTGVITIVATPYATTEIAVKFNNINDDATVAEQTIQMLQAQTVGDVGYAATEVTLQQALSGDNYFLDCITYEDVGPQIGTSQSLGFHCLALKSGASSVSVWTTAAYNGESAPSETVKKYAQEALKGDFNNSKGSLLDSTTLSAACTMSHDAAHKQIAAYYGEVVHNLFLARKNNDMTALNAAVSIAQKHLLNDVSDSETAYDDHALTTQWCTYEGNVERYGRYIVGTLKKDFLGGTIAQGDGYAFFDATCGRISAPNADALALQNNDAENKNNGHWITGYDYRSNVTILDYTPNSDGTGGYLYVCVWSKTLLDETQFAKNEESQRVLAFSRIPYLYDGGGKIRFTKVNENGDALEGAEYGIYSDAACTQLVEKLTSAKTAVESSELSGGTYYVKEITAPSGYLKDNTVYEVAVVGGDTPAELRVVDKRQTCELTFTVYDATTRDVSQKGKVEGVKFDLLRPNGTKVGTYTTNANGKLVDSDGDTTFVLDAIGNYTLKQVDTVTNYCMTNYPDTHVDYCGKIIVDANPTSGGGVIKRDIVHYEHRQVAYIRSQVQDGDWATARQPDTPAEIGGAGGEGYVTTIGATYRLKTKTEIFLGYVNGNKVTVPANTELSVWDGYGTESYSQDVISKNEGGKAYVAAKRVQVKYNNVTYNFPMPNGEYQWELQSPSNGYWKNPDTLVTAVDAKWKDENKTSNSISVYEYPVRLRRQKGEIEFILKSYDEKLERDADISAIKKQITTVETDAPAKLLSMKDALKDVVDKTWKRFVDDSYSKNVTTSDSQINRTSVDHAILKENGTPIYQVVADDIVPNCIYYLINTCAIVDIQTGEVIKEGSILGAYMTNSAGEFTITTLGSEGFDNPNERSNDPNNGGKAHIGGIAPISNSGKAVSGGYLPNGTYALTYYIVADDYKAEKGFAEAIIGEHDDLVWGSSTNNKEVLKAQTAAFVQKDDPPVDEFDLPVAPDPDPLKDPDDPSDTDPYDPYNPDVPDTNDNDDIPLVPTDWIEKHKWDYAYRVIDPDNFDDDGISLIVKDTMPQTFSFYVDERLFGDDGQVYKYYVNYYYEISKSEYEMSTAKERENKDYLFIPKSGCYFRRFGTDTVNTENKLRDIIVLNEKIVDHNGFINYGQISPDLTISGAIIDTEWLTKKMSNQQLLKDSDEDYAIMVVVDVHEIITQKYSNETIERIYTSKYGELRIKNRILVPLD